MSLRIPPFWVGSESRGWTDCLTLPSLTLARLHLDMALYRLFLFVFEMHICIFPTIRLLPGVLPPLHPGVCNFILVLNPFGSS